ncbi:hypothetical protein [Blastopirellula marina]|uniref:Uncharacterized protein n=1 Tax=Blastopirellula marina TaxID=124 RepID=A0A2S8GCP4_9BACT|nr:hypothetical protein [Blastopirellula marina]PQO42070.1 hypothetical protein C5Y93_27350 [Blastopirellula marina]
MNIAAALPVAVGAASLTAATLQQTTENFFSFFDANVEEADEKEVAASGAGLESFLASGGVLNAQSGDIRDELERLLTNLSDLLRRSSHNKGMDLPESYQLNINAQGELEEDPNDPFAQQLSDLIGNSEEADKLLSQIAAQVAALKSAGDQARFAQTYNEDPAAAFAFQQEAQSQRAGLNVTFVQGTPSSFQVVSE